MQTTPIRWYFDFLSPFAYLQWPRIRTLMVEHDIALTPILLAAVLQARGQKGPAEIPGKREFTYRHVLWQARMANMPLTFPAQHPFNPLPALRLCIAAGCTAPTVDTLFEWIWAHGNAADSAEALAPVCMKLGLAPEAAQQPSVKAALRDNTEAALANGVFGVPTLALGEALFWGNDAHDFALAVLDDPGLLDDADMQALAKLPIGIRREMA